MNLMRPPATVRRTEAKRLDHVSEIILIDGVDLHSDPNAHPGTLGDLDRAVGWLLRSDPTQEAEVIPSPLIERT
jgi:hypothetical protein